jgi:hypothetical protein
MNDDKFKVKWCPVCDQGWVVIAKDKKTGKLFCYCKECETEWTQPQDVGVKVGTHNAFGVASEPTIKDISVAGWGKYVIADPQ